MVIPGILSDYVHGLLAGDEMAAIDEHCRDCPSCQAELLAARGRLETLKSIPRDKATEALIQSVLARAAAANAENNSRPSLERLSGFHRRATPSVPRVPR